MGCDCDKTFTLEDEEKRSQPNLLERPPEEIEEVDDNIYLSYNSFICYYKKFKDFKARLKNEVSLSLSVFLVSTKSVSNFIEYIKNQNLNKDKNFEETNIEIYYDYKQCNEISQKTNGENEFIILDKNCMKKEIKNYNKIKEKVVTLKNDLKMINNRTTIIFNEENFISVKVNNNGFFYFENSINQDENYNPDGDLTFVNQK